MFGINLKYYILKQEQEYVHEEDKPRKGLNAELQQELHEKIISGEIEIGPMPDHSQPVKDIRPVLDGLEARIETLAKRNGYTQYAPLATDSNGKPVVAN